MKSIKFVCLFFFFLRFVFIRSLRWQRKVISETSFESGMSDDYAIPPDAVSQAESSCMDASMPSLMMRASYADSPNKKMESLEKV